MPRLLHDRYFAYDETCASDLVTGTSVRLDDLPADADEPVAGAAGDSSALLSLLDVLDDVREGAPRWVVADARSGPQAAAIAGRAADEARRRGFVPVLVSVYTRLRDQLAQALDERTLLLIETSERAVGPARAALLHAATRCPRPHVLLTFKSPSTAEESCSVREARAVYRAVATRPTTGDPRDEPLGDLARLVQREARAVDFNRVGRHAAAERLLRDVVGGFSRRRAFGRAAAAAVALGRVLLERGRAVAAEQAFEEAAGFAQSAGKEDMMLEAKLWQATARTDAARLTDAESVARAVLLASGQAPRRQAWAHAVLSRVLVWQGRIEEAAAPYVSRPQAAPDEAAVPRDSVVATWSEAIAIRALLASGHLFQAGLRARTLVAATAEIREPLPRLIAATAHLRVLAAAGDLELAGQRLRDVSALARLARAPLRAVWARLIWCDALRRAGRGADARRVLSRLSRLGRVAPALLKREIERRTDCSGDATPFTGSQAYQGTGQMPVLAAVLVRLSHAEENDDAALKQLLERISRELQPVRLDLVSQDAGPPSVVITTGAGLPTHLGARVLESGVAIEERLDGGREHGVPVRLGTRLLGALVARWPIDRRPPGGADEILDMAGAVAAPRLEALQASRRESSRASTAVPELIGVSAEMAAVRRAIERAARAPFAVMIEGESGVGKELAARAVHQLGPRRERQLCDVNCAALPDELLESELFGHARGAFTGAVVEKAGLFEDAHGGTLFLDEVADLTPRGQAKLLRVLQQHEVRRVGETFSRKVDVRVVTAANRDMRAEVAAGRFRSDLLYRLDVIRIRIPPLRERPGDIPALANHFWRASSARVGCTATLTHGVLSALSSYHWPGNVRELQNVMAALAVAAPARGSVRASLLPAAITGSARVTSCRLAEARAEFERRCVEVALARAGGSRTRAAAALGLSRQGLLKTMARLGLNAGVAERSEL